MKQVLLLALLCYSCNRPDSAFKPGTPRPDISFALTENSPDMAFKERERMFFDSLRTAYTIDTVFAANEVSRYDRSLHRVVYSKAISLYVRDKGKNVSSEDLKKICKRYYERVLNDTIHFSYVSVWYDGDSLATGNSYFPHDERSRCKFFNPKRLKNMF